MRRLEIKQAAARLSAPDARGCFEGYASLFHVADLARDMMMPGAFAESLRRKGAGGIRMLWQHDPAAPIGTWLAVTEDALGLRVRGQLNLEVARGRESFALLQQKAIDGLSIGFRCQRAASDRSSGLRRLLQVDLWEISIVTFPMLPQARVSSVKMIQPPGHRSRNSRSPVAEGGCG
jgi:HK97 family phage prohead protease